MHPNSMALFRRYARPYFMPGMNVLEVGPGHFPSEFEQAVQQNGQVTWQTIDIYEDPRITYSTNDPYRFPLPGDSFDVVFAANVLEHVPKPWRWIRELSRVCKVGGLVITINPVNWGFHQFPLDCWRAYPDGMKALYEDAGLETLLSKFESSEKLRHRINWHGLRLIIKYIVGRTSTGEPFIPLDIITIGRKTGAPVGAG